MNTCIEKRRGKTVASAFGFDKVHSVEIDRLMIFSESKSYWYFGIKTSNIFDEKWLHFLIGSSIVRECIILFWIKKGIERSHIPDVVSQGRMKQPRLQGCIVKSACLQPLGVSKEEGHLDQAVRNKPNKLLKSLAAKKPHKFIDCQHQQASCPWLLCVSSLYWTIKHVIA